MTHPAPFHLTPRSQACRKWIEIHRRATAPDAPESTYVDFGEFNPQPPACMIIETRASLMRPK